MLYFEKDQKTKKLLTELNNSAALLNCLNIASEFYLKMQKNYSAFYKIGDFNCINNYKTLVAEVRSLTSGVGTRKLFNEIERVESLIDAEFPELVNFSGQLSSFSNKYEKYIEMQDPHQTINMLFQAYQLTSVIDGLKFGVSIYSNNEAIHTEKYLKENEADLSILLSSHIDTLPQLTQKLKTFQSIYSELCFLVGFSETDYPARIVKVESGSLLIKIIGNSTVAALITLFSTEAASFLYRSYTTEGQIESINKRVEYLISFAKLKSELESQGIDTSKMDESIKKSAATLSDDFNRLISDQEVFRLNNMEIIVGGSQQLKLIATDPQPPIN